MVHAPRIRPGDAGFTLVELMVVLFIVGLMAGAVLLAMPDPRGRLADEGERFAARLKAAHDLAIVDNRPMAAVIGPRGYHFEERRAGAWQAVDAKPLEAADWSPETEVVTGEEDGQLRVHFDVTGLADPSATITLMREGAKFRVSIDAGGAVRVDG